MGWLPCPVPARHANVSGHGRQSEAWINVDEFGFIVPEGQGNCVAYIVLVGQ